MIIIIYFFNILIELEYYISHSLLEFWVQDSASGRD